MDNGSEYVSNDSINISNHHSIHKKFTIRYTPQKIVQMKRKQSIMEMKITVRREKHCLSKYWVEAIPCATYIINQYPTKNIINTFLKEFQSGRINNVCHMRVLLCVAYTHILDELRRNKDKKKEKNVYLLHIVMNPKHISCILQ